MKGPPVFCWSSAILLVYSNFRTVVVASETSLSYLTQQDALTRTLSNSRCARSITLSNSNRAASRSREDESTRALGSEPSTRELPSKTRALPLRGSAAGDWDGEMQTWLPRRTPWLPRGTPWRTYLHKPSLLRNTLEGHAGGITQFTRFNGRDDPKVHRRLEARVEG